MVVQASTLPKETDLVSKHDRLERDLFAQRGTVGVAQSATATVSRGALSHAIRARRASTMLPKNGPGSHVRLTAVARPWTSLAPVDNRTSQSVPVFWLVLIPT